MHCEMELSLIYLLNVCIFKVRLDSGGSYIKRSENGGYFIQEIVVLAKECYKCYKCYKGHIRVNRMQTLCFPHEMK